MIQPKNKCLALSHWLLNNERTNLIGMQKSGFPPIYFYALQG